MKSLIFKLIGVIREYGFKEYGLSQETRETSQRNHLHTVWLENQGIDHHTVDIVRPSGKKETIINVVEQRKIFIGEQRVF